MKLAALWLLRLLAGVLIAGTLLSTTDLNEWWIRIWDFPRVQILIAMIAIGIALWFFDRAWRPFIPIILLCLSGWQTYRVFPYTSLASPEFARAEPNEDYADACFSVLTLNVLQSNRDYARTINLIRQTDPDILLLTETDKGWAKALAPIMAGYPEQLHRPLDNTYGIMFATRLPMRDASIQDLAEKDTPSVFSTLMVGERSFRVIGLHPRPPTIDQDTEERDAELVLAARHARDIDMPVLAIGDFNDVAWSDTTRLFSDIGSFLDPRIGRGTFATFPADKIWLGWPLDHLFATEEFLLGGMKVGEPVGSDHRPFTAELCLAPRLARARNKSGENPSAEDEQEATEVLKDFKEDRSRD